MAFLISSTKNTNPNILIVSNKKEGNITLIDLLKERKLEKQKENDSEESQDSTIEQKARLEGNDINDPLAKIKDKIVLQAIFSASQIKTILGTRNDDH